MRRAFFAHALLLVALERDRTGSRRATTGTHVQYRRIVGASTYDQESEYCARQYDPCDRSDHVTSQLPLHGGRTARSPVTGKSNSEFSQPKLALHAHQSRVAAHFLCSALPASSPAYCYRGAPIRERSGANPPFP